MWEFIRTEGFVASRLFVRVILIQRGVSIPDEFGMTVTYPPTDEPWGVREFHLRHPDGHMFRVSAGLGSE